MMLLFSEGEYPSQLDPNPMSYRVRFPWWYHVLEQIWLVVESISVVEPTVGWKVIHPHLVGRLYFTFR
jgi:hypothetical protein